MSAAHDLDGHRLRLRLKSAPWAGSAWFWGNAGVYGAAALFLITALALGGAAATMLVMKSHADHAAQELRLSETLAQNIADLNAAGRAWLVLRDPDLLIEREEGKRKTQEAFAALHALAEDGKHAGIAQAVKLAARRIALFDAMIAAAGPPGTTVVAGEDERLKANRASYQALARLRDDANAEFKHYQQEIAGTLRLSLALALFTGLVSPVLGLIGIFLLKHDREIQQVRNLQAELMHVQRSNILGETAAMLAHEINQPLAAGTNYLAVLRRALESGSTGTALAVAEKIGAQTKRANAILRRLRRFIEKGESERDLEDPKVLVEDALALFGTIDRAVEIKTDIPDGLPRVMADRVELQQVLINLIRNAVEAMEGQEHREIRLCVRARSLSAVEVSLADNGPGLPPHVAARLFEPFVSTKASGMGVGLSICHAIIQEHQGRIWAENNPQGGTIFRFTLPAREECAAA